MSQKKFSMQEYADKYWEVLVKNLDCILYFLQVYKFLLGLKETLQPLVRKEKFQTLIEVVDLAILLKYGKKIFS